jgi:hypothetical protein
MESHKTRYSMANFLNRFAPFWILRGSLQFTVKILASLILSSAILGISATIAKAEPTQITLSIDATLAPTFSDLVNQAEFLAEIEISRLFQADPTLSELEVRVLGERNGQLVSLLSSRVSRDAWQASSNIRQWAQYFPTSSALLGYRNSDPVSTRVAVRDTSTPSVAFSPAETLEQARLARRISEEEYWQLVDAID